MRRATFFTLLAVVASCAEPAPDDVVEEPPQTSQDAQPGGLFHDFFEDGKFDAAGHPQGAEVFEGDARCAPSTGAAGKFGFVARTGLDQPGVLCGAETRALGAGTFALNVRAALLTAPKDPAEPVAEIVAFDGDQEVATRTLVAADFGDLGVDQDLAVRFRHPGQGAVTFEVRWSGAADVRFNYAEVFRSTPRLVVSPASSVLDGVPTFEIEMQDPREGMTFAIDCDGADRTAALDELIAEGVAERVETEFRAVVRAPVDRLLDGCATPSRVRVSAMVNGWATETSRVTYYGEQIPCAFDEAPDTIRVLLSGFEPFPADSDRDNSSREAVEAYFAGDHPPGTSVMRVILPVEYDAAPALLADLIDRCEPDIVVGFGQGRSIVDVETIAYNRKDSAGVAGGVPDNRGVVFGGDPVVEGGVPEHRTGLPADAILSGLGALGIAAGPSTDPGRYVCNNLFYTIMESAAQRPGLDGGFVHLPRIPTVSDADRVRLRDTVATVVDAALVARASQD